MRDTLIRINLEAPVVAKILLDTISGDEAVQKGRHPALDAGSPTIDIGRRYRIGVRYDEIAKIIALPRPFWTAS